SEIIARIWLGSSHQSPLPPRTIPLIQLRGITQSIAERLGEEGIQDVSGLAYANPLKLLRNTPYDWRQVVNWMDEALLMVNLPDGWEQLEKIGITGSIDLAWYADGDAAAEIKSMADSVKIDEKLFGD